MAGAELIGQEELEQIQRLFAKENVNLYRYGKNNFMTREFEQKFADYMGVKYAHAVSSGTAAIHCALDSADVGPGDEVITTAFTFIAPIEAIAALGATPVPVNIDETYHLDIAEVEQSITAKTKAVVCIPMWAPPKMQELVALCEKHNLILIEDAAQALGASYQGKKLGTFGDIGSFSFDAGKSLHTGEGGMIITDNEELYKKAAEFSDHGHMHLPNLPRGLDPRRKKGLNYRMSELNAAVGIAQLQKIDFILSKAKENKKQIKEQIKHIPNLKFRPFTDEIGAQGDTLIFQLDSTQSASLFEAHLKQHQIGTKILPEAIEWHYAGVWDHLLKLDPFYQDINLEERFKKTGDQLRSSICLNIPLQLSGTQIDTLVKAISEAAKLIQGERISVG